MDVMDWRCNNTGYQVPLQFVISQLHLITIFVQLGHF